MLGLLTIGGKLITERAKLAHMVGHLPDTCEREAASRGVAQVYHTCQGFPLRSNERARSTPNSTCAALTWCERGKATRTGSRERGAGGGRRWSRQEDTPHGRQGRTIREPFRRLRWGRTFAFPASFFNRIQGFSGNSRGTGTDFGHILC